MASIAWCTALPHAIPPPSTDDAARGGKLGALGSTSADFARSVTVRT